MSISCLNFPINVFQGQSDNQFWFLQKTMVVFKEIEATSQVHDIQFAHYDHVEHNIDCALCHRPCSIMWSKKRSIVYVIFIPETCYSIICIVSNIDTRYLAGSNVHLELIIYSCILNNLFMNMHVMWIKLSHWNIITVYKYDNAIIPNLKCLPRVKFK